MQDFGANLGVTILTDASAAKGIASRRGLGKVRHIEVNQLWVQEKVSNGEITILKIGTRDNLADALTKYVEAETLNRHILGTNQGIIPGRHVIMPENSLNTMHTESCNYGKHRHYCQHQEVTGSRSKGHPAASRLQTLQLLQLRIPLIKRFKTRELASRHFSLMNEQEPAIPSRRSVTRTPATRAACRGPNPASCETPQDLTSLSASARGAGRGGVQTIACAPLAQVMTFCCCALPSKTGTNKQPP